MIYLLKNMRMLLQKRKLASICLVIGFMATFTILLFVYGVIYQISEKKLAQVNAVNCFDLEITNPSEVTWDRFQKCFKKFDKNTNLGISNIAMKAVIDTTSDDYYDLFSFSYNLDAQGNPQYTDWGSSLQSQGLMYEGRWFTKEEFDNASKVAIGNPYEYIDTGGQDIYTKKYENGSDDVYLINGEEYRRVGVALFWTTPIIPVTCLAVDAQVKELGIVFENDSVTTAQYNDIKNAVNEEFGSAVKVPDLQMEDLDTNYYFMVFCIVVVMGIICICVLSLLICYLFEEQKDVIRAYRVCGVRKRVLRISLTGEISIFLTVSMGIVLPIYLKCVLPNISKSMGYFVGAYTVKAVILLAIGYEMISFFVSHLLAGKELL